LRELTKTEILYITSLVASFVLFFVAVGLLLSNTAGSVLVPYSALFAAIALSSSTLIVGVLKKRKTVSETTESKPYVPSIHVSIEKPVIAASPLRTEQVTKKVPNNYQELKIDSSKLYTADPFRNRKTLESNPAKPKIAVSEPIEEPNNQFDEPLANKTVVKSASEEKVIPEPYHYRKIYESRPSKPKSEVSQRIEEPRSSFEKPSSNKNVAKSSSEEKATAEPFHYGKTTENTKPKIEFNERIEEPQNSLEKTLVDKNIVKPAVEQKAVPEPQPVKAKNGLLTCPNCKKTFSQPIFMVSYNDANHPTLVAHCPYCDQALDFNQETTTTEVVWKKYVENR